MQTAYLETRESPDAPDTAKAIRAQQPAIAPGGAAKISCYPQPENSLSGFAALHNLYLTSAEGLID